MIVINCTKKLFKRIRYEAVADGPESTGALGPWCANVFYISRYPFVIVTNEKTLLTVLFPLKEFKNINLHFMASLEKQLKELKVPSPVIAAEVAHAHEMVLSDRTNRSTLGSMNDLVFHIKAVVESRSSFTVAELERGIRDIPFAAMKFATIDESVVAQLTNTR